MKQKAIELASRKGYNDILSIFQVKPSIFVAYSKGKARNIELFIDVKQKIVREVGK